MNAPPIDLHLRDIEREEAAADALARFHAEWPPERSRRLRDAVCGTPAERDAANASFLADALASNQPETPADAAARGLLSDTDLLAHSKEQRRFKRTSRGVGL